MFPAPLILILGGLLIIGVLLWGLNRIPWIDADAKATIRVIVIVCVAIWLIYMLMGFLAGGGVAAYPWRR